MIRSLPRHPALPPALALRFLLGAFLLLALPGGFVAPAGAFVLPANFEIDDAVPGVTFTDPTGMCFLTPNRFLVAEQSGMVWMIDHGARLTTPFVDLSRKVLYNGDRGLLGLAADPNFMTNHYIYLLFTVDPDSATTDVTKPAYGRLERYTVSASDSNRLDLTTRVVLMGRTWAEGPESGSITHTIGSLRFGADGTLLVSCGEGAEYAGVDAGGRDPGLFTAGRCDPNDDVGAFRAQMITCLAGKILRLDPATGHGLPSNPYWDGNAASVRSRVWEYGLRNPFRFAVKPGSGAADPSLGNPGTLLIGDVGWETWEELDVASSGGKNFGWPCNEGTHVTASYPGASPAHSDCSTLGTPSNPALATAPIADWSHIDDTQSSPPGVGGAAAIGGQFYTGNLYPSQYRNQFFFGDYMGNWIKVARLDGSNNLIDILPFGDDMQNPVDFALNPASRDLYFVAAGAGGAGTGNVYHILWTGPAGVPDAGAGRLALSSAIPNPTRLGTHVTLALPARASIALSVLDVGGRQVWHDRPREIGSRHLDAAMAGSRRLGSPRAGGALLPACPVGRRRAHAPRDPAFRVAPRRASRERPQAASMRLMNDDLEPRRARLAAAWNLSDEVVVIGAGEPISVPGGADQVYPFIAHAEYFWLVDRETPGGVLAFDPKDGWTDFTPAISEAERVWEGRSGAPGTPLPELAGWLAARRGRRVVPLGVPLAGLAPEAGRAAELRETMMHARRPKDATELARIRHAAAATADGFAAAVRTMRAGVTERAVQIELEAAFFRGGAQRTAYGTIVGAGSHSGVLHFDPGERVIGAGDTILIDAGAEVGRYCADVTRSYRVGGSGDAGFFRDLYALVLAVEEHAIARCVPGAEWRDVHLASALEITTGLVAMGLLRGEPASLVERDVTALFYPHGLGHLVGLGVRDASGYLPGRTRSPRPGLSMLRTDLPLEPGYVITVEPGVYFIPALLQDPERRKRFADAVAWNRIDALFEWGGIRIEDNIHVTGSGPENLTAAIPKTHASALLA